MKDKKVVIYSDKINPTFVKTVIVKYSFQRLMNSWNYLIVLIGKEIKNELKRIKNIVILLLVCILIMKL